MVYFNVFQIDYFIESAPVVEGLLHEGLLHEIGLKYN